MKNADKKFYTYLILTVDNKLYCGYTDDPEKRFEKHKAGLAAKYTRTHKPLKMVYIKEFDTKSEAMKEECRIKTLTRKQKKRRERIFGVSHCSHSEAIFQASPQFSRKRRQR